MSLPSAFEPTSAEARAFAFDVVPVGGTYDAILHGEPVVTLALTNYVPRGEENDVLRIIYGNREMRAPWSQCVEVELQEAERRVITRRAGDTLYKRRTHVAAFAGTTVVGEAPTQISGIVHKTKYGWAILPDLSLDRPDVPALKILSGELPLDPTINPPASGRHGSGYRRRGARGVWWNREEASGKYDDLYGSPERVLAALRKSQWVAGAPYITPEGRKSS